MSNSKVFKKVSSLIKEVLSTEKVTKEIERLLNVKRRLGEEMERLDEERRNEPVIELKELIDVKRDRVRDQYKAIINDIKALQEQEDDSQGNKERLDKMLSFLNNKKLTPDMLTKDIIEAFIYRIIAIDEGNLVFIIDTSHKVSVEALIDQRYEIIKKDPIYQSQITGLDPIKKEDNQLQSCSCLIQKNRWFSHWFFAVYYINQTISLCMCFRLYNSMHPPPLCYHRYIQNLGF